MESSSRRGDSPHPERFPEFQRQSPYGANGKEIVMQKKKDWTGVDGGITKGAEQRLWSALGNGAPAFADQMYDPQSLFRHRSRAARGMARTRVSALWRICFVPKAATIPDRVSRSSATCGNSSIRLTTTFCSGFLSSVLPTPTR